MSLIRRYHANTIGRDFVVGDIHGCFDVLEQALQALRFNATKDRLFSVGDLGDRGPFSERALHYLAQPWFLAVRGNHEQLAIDYFHGCLPGGNFMANGGAWFMGLSHFEQKEIVLEYERLPVAIEIDGKVGIVHAEPAGPSWPAFLENLESPGYDLEITMNTALWSRSRIDYCNNNPVAGIDRVFVGHVIVPQPMQLGNVHAMDTGCFAGGGLTIAHLDGTIAIRQPSPCRWGRGAIPA